MTFDCILIRYGELALKKKNRQDFVAQLMRNIKDKCKAYKNISVYQTRGRLFIDLNGTPHEPIIEKLKQVFGLVGFSPALKVPSELGELQQASLALLQAFSQDIHTFKIISKRADKTFPLRSNELNQKLGAYLLSHGNGIKVDVHQPDLSIHIEVRGRFSYVYGNDILGLGGLPVGASGKVSLLLSGGIDSPVAGYLASKRGVALTAVHFHSFPYTSERSKEKVVDLARILTRFSGKIKLLVVPFTEIQTEINKHCYSSYSITVMRRFMFRIAEQLAKQNQCLALATGESIGQVASQTLESMQVINEVTDLPVLRPLVGMDKVEIMEIAKKIGTYETSILPYEDCCTIFLPKAPKTKPNKQIVLQQEKLLDVDHLIEKAIKGTETIHLSSDQENEDFSYF